MACCGKRTSKKVSTTKSRGKKSAPLKKPLKKPSRIDENEFKEFLKGVGADYMKSIKKGRSVGFRKLIKRNIMIKYDISHAELRRAVQIYQQSLKK